MKMLKKMAALLLAGVMAMALLTACGDDTPSYRLQKIVEASQKSGKTYVDVNVDSGNAIFATSGKESYLGLPVGSNQMYEMVIKEDGTCVLNSTAKTYFKTKTDSSATGMVDTVVPNQSKLSGIAVVPQYEIKNVGTFYAEVITSEGAKIAYCFDGDKVVYIVIEASTETTVIKVNKWTNEIPEEIQNKMALKGYTEIAQ